jgi:hypothetical protein
LSNLKTIFFLTSTQWACFIDAQVNEEDKNPIELEEVPQEGKA